MKKCSKCNTEKSFDCFYKQKSKKHGLCSWCKICDDTRRLNYNRTIEGLVSKIYVQQKNSSKKRVHKPPSYSKHELKDWLLSQYNFQELYDNWVESGYKKNLIPSVDRPDDYKGYTLDNIQLMTWGENKKKGHEDRKNGINNKRSKPIISKNIKNLEVNFYHSISEAARFLNTTPQNIWSCLNGIQKTCKGHEFYYQ